MKNQLHLYKYPFCLENSKMVDAREKLIGLKVYNSKFKDQIVACNEYVLSLEYVKRKNANTGSITPQKFYDIALSIFDRKFSEQREFEHVDFTMISRDFPGIGIETIRSVYNDIHDRNGNQNQNIFGTIQVEETE